MRKKTFYTFSPKEGDRRLRQLHDHFCRVHPGLSIKQWPLFLPLTSKNDKTPQPQSPLLLTCLLERWGGIYLGTDLRADWPLSLPGILIGFGSLSPNFPFTLEPLTFKKGYIDLVHLTYTAPLGKAYLRWEVEVRTSWRCRE
jgi:hypothetical protein